MVNTGLPNGGRTAKYTITYDDSLAPADGIEIATALVNSCDADFALMADWFSGVDFKYDLPIDVAILTGSGGASSGTPSDLQQFFGYTPSVAIRAGTGASSQLVRYLLVTEVVELFMASQNAGWFEPFGLFHGADEGSKGEGLSRFLGQQFKRAIGNQDRFYGYEIVGLWLNSDRPNFVDNNPDDHSADVVNGCTTAFISYLYGQCGKSVKAIIGAPESTLGGVYTRLTGLPDGWQTFIDLVNTYYPPRPNYAIDPYDVPNDTLFPVANLSSLLPASMPAGSSLNERIVILDRAAVAGARIALASDNPATLSVAPFVDAPAGDWAVGLDLTAASVVGPAQSVNIRASYAGRTLVVPITITPRASTLIGRVTDQLRRPLVDASVLITCDVGFTATGSNSLQLSTAADGRYQAGDLPPHRYGISAIQGGYVPAETSVTIGEGVPVTVQNFALAQTLPFTVSGTVTSPAGAVSGATIVFDRNSPIPGRIETATDEQGLYSLSMDPGPYDGDYTLYVTADGFVPANLTMTIPNGAAVVENFALVPVGTLSGTIRDTSGAPVANAQVSAGPLSSRSDANGAYSLPGLAPGATAVGVSATGYNSIATQVMITSAVNTLEDFSLTPATGSVGGKVVDTVDRSPIADARVTIASKRSITGDDGSYSLQELPAGVLHVTASVAGYQTLQTTVTLIDHETLSLNLPLTKFRHKGDPLPQ